LVPLGEWLRECRRKMGLTQDELADLSGVSAGTIRDIEQGRVVRPRLASVGRLATALGVDVDAVLQSAPAAIGRDFLAIPVNALPAFSLRMLGSLSVLRDGVNVSPTRFRVRVTLGLLALHANSLLYRDTIIDALWGEDPPQTSPVMIQSYIGAIRRLLEPRAPLLLVSSGTGYRLNLDNSQADHLAFERLVADARKARSSGQAEAAEDLYARALGLWRGEPLADVAALWDHPAVLGLRNLRAASELEYADVLATAGRYERALPLLQELARRDALNERAHAGLMLALAATGQQAAALQVYDGLLRKLDDELGIRPGPEVTNTHLKVLRQEIPPAAQLPIARYAAGPPPGTRPATAGTGSPSRAEPAVPGTPQQLPGTIPHLAGRESELAVLNGLLNEVGRRAPGAAVISVVGGMAGVGKTALALYFAHRAARRFPEGQLYADLRGFDPSGTPATPVEAIRGFLAALRVGEGGIPSNPLAMVELYRSLLVGKQMLIVLDNARDEQQVRPLLPASPGCLVLITSRNSLAGLAVTYNARILALDVLTESSARQLLTRRLGAQRAAADPAAVTEIVRLCARLPLALAIAAVSAATRSRLPLASLASELRDAQGRLDVLDVGDPATSIRAVFSWSTGQLSPDAARMFRLLGLHPGPDISAAAAASLADVPVLQARAAIGELVRTHLLDEHAPDRFAFHDLLRAYAVDQARLAENAETED
jgi:DNA-binding SARP family transcriptional activator/DNA-binding XRE family transcriptional regulator